MPATDSTPVATRFPVGIAAIRVRQAARRARSGSGTDGFSWLVDRSMHDLRNSLSAIRIGVELMHRADGTGPSPSAAVLAHIDSASQRAHALSAELADACRLASGHGLLLHPRRIGLHTAVRQALDALPDNAAASAIEHDRLGEGDCTADPARMAQFIALAIDEISASAPSALVIVISEVAGEHFRIAVHGDGARRALLPPASPHVARQAQDEARRRALLLQAVAQAHGGRVQIRNDGGTDRTVDASFASLPRGRGAA
jgi:signal transduction histidine kinase